MNKNNFISIVDFGSANLRLGVFDNKLNNLCNFSRKIENSDNYDECSNSINFLIKESEKNISSHLENVIVMFDDPEIISIDLSIKKNFDQKMLVKDIYPSIILEANQLIKNNSSNKKVIHVIANKYTINGNTYSKTIKNDLKVKSIIIEIKFICLPLEKYNNIVNIFKKNNLQILNCFCSSYVKSLSYINSFNNYEIVAFLDIGWQRSTLYIFNKKKLNFINSINVGGNHITKDISKILEIDFHESEKIKKLFTNSEIEFSFDNKIDNKDDSLIKKALDTKISVDLLKKVVFARVEEIIELVFKDFNFRENINDSSNSVLVLTGNGSKLFNKNTFHLDNKFNFKEINFYEESDLEICKAGVDLDSKWHNDETKQVSKSVKKKGFFEKFFNFFGN
tara:strand:- start:4035 stop:5216 length:1182 start_codon:yes stop_codon:yes gene_type:complete